MVVNLCLPHFDTTIHCNKVGHITFTCHLTVPCSTCICTAPAPRCQKPLSKASNKPKLIPSSRVLREHRSTFFHMLSNCWDRQTDRNNLHRHNTAQDGDGGRRCENKEAEGQRRVWETESQLTLSCSFYWYFEIWLWLYYQDIQKMFFHSFKSFSVVFFFLLLYIVFVLFTLCEILHCFVVYIMFSLT